MSWQFCTRQSSSQVLAKKKKGTQSLYTISIYFFLSMESSYNIFPRCLIVESANAVLLLLLMSTRMNRVCVSVSRTPWAFYNKDIKCLATKYQSHKHRPFNPKYFVLIRPFIYICNHCVLCTIYRMKKSESTIFRRDLK